MSTGPAPYFDAIADGPDGGHAVWRLGADGVRVRVGLWPGGAKGTVLVLPGRTECIEKYGRGARDLLARGYSAAAIDWRGQGIADRALPDRRVGHVADFAEYQMDFAELLAAVREARLPAPYYLLGHSMGGCIGLRAMIEGARVQAAVFSAPMWGIGMRLWQRLLVGVLAPLLGPLRLGGRKAIGTRATPYMIWHAFESNLLTSDPEMYDYMRAQVLAEPSLGLGGPSNAWVVEALRETAALADAPRPGIPALVCLGADEQIVDVPAVRAIAREWPACELWQVPGARHEIPMETQAIRRDFYDRACALFDANR